MQQGLIVRMLKVGGMFEGNCARFNNRGGETQVRAKQRLAAQFVSSAQS